jgi:hypothetical protein
MTAGDDHDPIAEGSSLGCDSSQGSGPKDNPNGAISEDRSRIAELLSIGPWQLHGTLSSHGRELYGGSPSVSTTLENGARRQGAA